MKFFLRIILFSLVFFLFVEYSNGINLIPIDYNYPFTFLFVFLIILLFDIVIRPIVNLVTMPINILTLGLSSILVQILALFSISYLFNEFSVDSLFSLVYLALSLTLVRILTN